MRFLIAGSLIALLPTLALPSQANRFTHSVPVTAPRDFIHTPVASMQDLVELVKAVKRGRLPERRLLLKLQNGGLAFDLTDANLQTVSSAGASRHVLTVLKGLTKQPQPVPEPRNGTLIVACQPVDCTISINGTGVGRTDHGKSQPLLLAEGQYVIRAAADQSEPDQPEKSVALHARDQTTVVFRFQPTREALDRAARELYGKVVNALGGSSALNSAKSFSAAGTLQLADRGGAQTSWGMQVLSRDADTTKFTFTRATRTHTALEKGGQVRWDHPPTEVASIEDVIGRICELQLPNLLARFASPQFTFTMDKLPVAGGDNTFRVNGTPDSYLITVDPLMHVKQIQVRSSGLNDGIKVLYGNYTSGAGPVYPKVMQIVLPDRPRHGAEIDYSSLTYAPTGVSDRDFTLAHEKKKKRERRFLLFSHS